MIDEDDLLDPALNDVVSENQPSGVRIPEYAVKKLLAFSLRNVRASADQADGLLDELFAELSAGEILRIKGFFRDHPNIQVGVNFPRQDSSLPLVCVVNMGEIESSRMAFLGDRTGSSRAVLGTGRQVRRPQRAVGMDSVVDVIVGTQDPDLTMWLHHVVKATIFMNKLQLVEFYDVHNLVISGRDLRLDSSVMPQFGFYKTVSLQFQTFFDYNVPADGNEAVSSVAVRLGLLVDALKDGEPYITQVPGEQE